MGANIQNIRGDQVIETKKEKFTLGLVLTQETTYLEEEDLPELLNSYTLESVFTQIASAEEGKRIFELVKKLIEAEIGKTGEDDRVRACVR